MKYVVRALVFVLMASAGFAVEIKEEHQLLLRNLWWLGNDHGRPKWFVGDINGDKPADPGQIEVKEIKWGHGFYPILKYDSVSADRFTIEFKLGSIEFTHYKNKLWQGRMVTSVGAENYFRTSADAWPLKTPIDFEVK